MTTFSLTAMILLPFLGAAMQAVIGRPSASRWFAFISSVSSALIGLAILGYGLAGFSSESLLERLPWVGSYAISYELAIDGISRVGVLMVSILFPVLIASEWGRTSGARGMHALFLILQGALLGAACAQDLFLLFFFWSISSIPIFFLVGIWGGEKKEAAAFRTLVASALANALLFGAFVLIYYSKEPHTFLISELLQGGAPEKQIHLAGVDISASKVSFLFIFLATALRVPVWPFHGWFTRLMVEAPASVAVAVAAAVVPSGILIFARLGHELFPAVFHASADWILAAGLVSMLVGTFVVSVEKRLSSILSWIVIVQVGVSLIAIGSQHSSAMVGLVYQQLSSALAVAGLGLVFGAMSPRILTAGHTTVGSGSSNLVFQAPVASAITAFSLATIVGLPGLSGFIGQSLIVLGSFERSPWIAVLVGFSHLVLITGLFGVYRALFLSAGQLDGSAEKSDNDLTGREKGFLVPLVVLMVIFGLYPKPILDEIRPTAEGLLERVLTKKAPEAPPAATEAAGTPEKSLEKEVEPKASTPANVREVEGL